MYLSVLIKKMSQYAVQQSSIFYQQNVVLQWIMIILQFVHFLKLSTPCVLAVNFLFLFQLNS